MLDFLQQFQIPSLTVIAPAVAALIGVAASLANSFLARRELRTRIIEADYQSKRLDVIQRALAVQETFGDRVLPHEGIQALKDEYLHVVACVRQRREEPPPKPVRLPPRRRTGIRSLLLPRPITISGWLATPIYYLYGTVTIAYVLYAVIAAADVLGFREMLDFILMGALVSAVVAGAAHRWALTSWDRKTAQFAG